MINEGEDGGKYSGLYETYVDVFVQKNLEVFLEVLSAKNKKRALKKSHMKESEVNKYYIKGLEGDENFKNFADKYFQIKLKKYLDEIFKGKTRQNAFKNAGMIEKDLKYHKKDIEDALIEKQMSIAIKLVEDDENAKIIANQTKISTDEVFEWHIKGWEVMSDLRNFHKYSGYNILK